MTEASIPQERDFDALSHQLSNARNSLMFIMGAAMHDAKEFYQRVPVMVGLAGRKFAEAASALLMLKFCDEFQYLEDITKGGQYDEPLPLAERIHVHLKSTNVPVSVLNGMEDLRTFGNAVTFVYGNTDTLDSEQQSKILFVMRLVGKYIMRGGNAGKKVSASARKDGHVGNAPGPKPTYLSTTPKKKQAHHHHPRQAAPPQSHQRQQQHNLHGHVPPRSTRTRGKQGASMTVLQSQDDGQVLQYEEPTAFGAREDYDDAHDHVLEEEGLDDEQMVMDDNVQLSYNHQPHPHQQLHHHVQAPYHTASDDVDGGYENAHSGYHDDNRGYNGPGQRIDQTYSHQQQHFATQDAGNHNQNAMLSPPIVRSHPDDVSDVSSYAYDPRLPTSQQRPQKPFAEPRPSLSRIPQAVERLELNKPPPVPTTLGLFSVDDSGRVKVKKTNIDRTEFSKEVEKARQFHDGLKTDVAAAREEAQARELEKAQQQQKQQDEEARKKARKAKGKRAKGAHASREQRGRPAKKQASSHNSNNKAAMQPKSRSPIKAKESLLVV